MSRRDRRTVPACECYFCGVAWNPSAQALKFSALVNGRHYASAKKAHALAMTQAAKAPGVEVQVVIFESGQAEDGWSGGYSVTIDP